MTEVQKTKALKFNNTSITFVMVGSSWFIPAKLLGLALGYPKEGQKLADALSTSWAKKWTDADFTVLRGKALETIRKATPEFGVPSSTSQLMMLTPSGVVKVLQRSRAGLAQEFRNFLAKNATALFKDHLGALKPPAKQLDLALPEREDESKNNLGDTMKVIEVMSKKGLMTKKEQKLALSRILDIKMTALSRENKVTHFFNPDGTVDPTKLPALSSHAMAIGEGSINLIERGQRHPEFKDWESAHDIGTPYGLKSDLVKKYCKAYVLALASDLPNNIAEEFIERSGGKFPPPDKFGFLVDRSVEKTVGGIAIYSKIDGNKLVWRNYWSPEAVRVIKGMLETDRGLKPIQTAEIVKAPASQATVDGGIKEAAALEELDKRLPKVEEHQN